MKLPVLHRPPAPGADLGEYLRANRPQLDRELLEIGAILFRGFGVDSTERFHDVVADHTPDLLDYTYRSTPRREEGRQVYTSTEYPAGEEIPMHNENSYAHSWPLMLWFNCAQPAAAGGATPLADSRRVAERIPPDLQERFAERGVMYVRNYSRLVDLAWQEVFQTDDRLEVERFCRKAGIEYEWRDDRLRTRQVCQGVARHPVTGEVVWFNQAHLFHPSALSEDVHEDLLTLFGPDDLPRDARCGDGTPFQPEELEAIRAAYRAEMVDVDWERGDVLLVDNMLVAHGRRPYTPPRRVLVAMAEAHPLVATRTGEAER